MVEEVMKNLVEIGQQADIDEMNFDLHLGF